MKISKRTGIAFLVLLLVIGIVSGVAAKYITSRSQKAQMSSSGFHISSNYLKDTDKAASYSLADWDAGFDIELYNYETDNIALIADDDINYTIKIKVNGTETDGWTASVGGTTQETYTMGKSSTRTTQTIHITPPTSPVPVKGDTVTVTVTATAPYSKTLQADFTVNSKKSPDYSWSYNSATGVTTLVIRTNDFSGTYTVTWNPSYYTPDTTDSRMSGWIQTAGSGTLTVSQDSTYTLLFLINGTPSSSGSGTGTTAALT